MRRFVIAILFVALQVAIFVKPAFAGEEVWESESHLTTFVMPVSTACSGGKVISYSTAYGGTKYSGTLSIVKTKGCGTRRVDIVGPFRDASKDGSEQCLGQLELSLGVPPDYVGGRGSAKWSSVKAVPGYSCSSDSNPNPIKLIQVGP